MKWITILISAALVGMFGIYLMGKAARPDAANSDGYNLEKFRRGPVLDGGRVKPVDTLARTTLRVLSGREEFSDAADNTQPAIRWFIEVVSHEPFDPRALPPKDDRTGLFWSAQVFKIDNDGILNVLKLK